MKKYLIKPATGAAISGLLTYTAICQVSMVMSWICYIPLFLVIYNKTPKQVFKLSLISALSFSCFAFYWMIPGAERFTGFNILYGLLVFTLAAIIYALFFALLFYIFSLIRKKDNNLQAAILNSISIAALFCLFEAVLMLASAGLPWFDIHAGNGLSENLYTLQPASLFSIYIMSFVVVAVNYLFAFMVLQKLWMKLWIPAAVIGVYTFFGALLLQDFNSSLQKTEGFDVAVLAENIAPEVKWDDQTGNMLVQHLLELNQQAAALKPAMILWSESAIPWTYSKDDELLKAVLNITDPAGIMHIMGINTASKENEVFNSAYGILPGGVVAGRYDKQYLLSFIEKPLNGWLMPFFSSKGFVAVNDMTHNHPLSTPYGKAGMLICNEAAIPAAASGHVKRGAEFLLNMSNDGWFSNTYIVNLHYHYARIRAVETRKDVAINCNKGFSGLIKASGSIESKEKSSESFVETVRIHPNKIVPLACSHPALFLYGCGIFLTGILLIRILKR